MNPSSSYIILSIVVFALIAMIVFIMPIKAQGKRLTPLAGLAFGTILAGLVFGEERLIGYSLIGVGVILAIIDIIRKMKPA